MQWVKVEDALPKGDYGVPYMSQMTKPVLVRHKDRPDYPITAHALLTNDPYGHAGIKLETNGASEFKYICWYSACCDLTNPFGLIDQDYSKFTSRIFGSKIIEWSPIPEES